MIATRWPIELLAPARDLECGRAAIDHGAYAVYVGAPRFGARAAAGLSLADIEALVAHAHRFWVRVYVAMNTLLTDAELVDARELARELAELGIDGLIVQDVGWLRGSLPPGLSLIASTQMHNREPARVRFWSDVGFSRAILARELSLDEIRAVRRAAPEIELECFVHGSLCVSYSGQCYLSHALGGRSGNRGECAQPCRKQYSLVDARGRRVAADSHLLSLRDLDLSGHLAGLLDAGVTSFKIEGRLKDRAYVATVVAHYRALLEPLLAERGLARASSGRADCALPADPERVFHRGRTTYFLLGRPARLATLESPKSLGPRVGRVARVRGRAVELAGEPPPVAVHAGDGLVFFDAAGELRGTRVNVAQGAHLEVETPFGLAPGLELRRNHDHAYLAAASRSSPRRAIGVTLTLRARDQWLVLEAEDEDGVRATAVLAEAGSVARDPERSRAVVARQLAKLGDTEFVGVAVSCEVEPLPHLPVSALNALRREVVSKLQAARAAARPRWPAPPPPRPPSPARFPDATLDYRGNVLNAEAAAFYEQHGVSIVERAPEGGSRLEGRIVMTMKYCVLHELGGCPRHGGVTLGEAPFTLVDTSGGGRRFGLRLDCRTCEVCLILEAGTSLHPAG